MLSPTTTTGTGILVNLGMSDSVTVGSDVVLTSTDGTVISGYGSGQEVIVLGTIVSQNYAILLSPGYNFTSGNSVTIAEGASVSSSGAGGVICHGSNASVINHGVIDGDRYGVSLYAANSETHSTVLNTGIIRATQLGVFRDSSYTSETIILDNRGLIETDGLSYGCFHGEHTGRDLITNSGKMVGAIELAGGQDRYDGRKGQVEGQVFGGADADILLGGKEANRFFGDAGTDLLLGGLGADTLTGGADADQFSYRSIRQSGRGEAKRDVITDFEHGVDLIDLKRIDANKTDDFNQEFDFMGMHKFSGSAGELRLKTRSNDTLILADIDGDCKADFEIALNATIALAESDFVL